MVLCFAVRKNFNDTEKKCQLPVSACLKKLISDPGSTLRELFNLIQLVIYCIENSSDAYGSFEPGG